MSLGDHYNPEGRRLQAGVHEVEVTEFDKFKYNSGNEGVAFTMQGDSGSCKASFVLVAKALWNLANFAAACGMSKEDMDLYSVTDNSGHQKLVGRKLQVRIVKVGDYHEVADGGWFSLDTNVIDRSAEMASSTQEQQPPTSTPF